MANKKPILPNPALITSENENWSGVYLRHDRQPPFEIPRHTHAKHTIIIGMDDGLEAEWSIDGQFRDLQYNQGDVFIVPAGVPHKAYWKQQSEGILLALEPESVADAVIDSVNRDRIEIIPQFGTTDLQLLQIAQWLLAELQKKQLAGSLYVDSLTTVLAVHLLRNYCTVEQSIPQYQGGLAQHKLRRAIAFIHEHLDRDLGLKDLAAVVDMSPYHFARMFKQSTGFTPYQYLVRQRLTKAKELLRSTEMAIADIGHSVGYKNSSHFAKVFRRQVGVSPTDYRNAVR